MTTEVNRACVTFGRGQTFECCCCLCDVPARRVIAPISTIIKLRD